MKTFIRNSFITVALLLGMAATANAQFTLYSAFVGGAATAQKAITGRANVDKITVAATNASVTLYFWDNVTNAPYHGTNVVVPEHTVRNMYSSNIVNSYVGMNGYTNWYTNSGVFSITTTNAAATNAANPLFTAVVPANTVMDFENLGILANKGITVRAATNATVVIYYTTY